MSNSLATSNEHWVVIDVHPTGSTWSGVQRLLQDKGHTCTVLQLSDLTQSRPHERDMTLAGLADAAALRVTPPFNLAGHGLGARIALELAARSAIPPRRVFVLPPAGLHLRMATRLATGRAPRAAAQLAATLSPPWLRAWSARTAVRQLGPQPVPKSAIRALDRTVRDPGEAVALLGQSMGLAHDACTTPLPVLDCPVRLGAHALPMVVRPGWDWRPIPGGPSALALSPKEIATAMIRFSEATASWAELEGQLPGGRRLRAKAWAPNRDEAVGWMAKVFQIGIRNPSVWTRAAHIRSRNLPVLRAWRTVGVGFGLLELSG